MIIARDVCKSYKTAVLSSASSEFPAGQVTFLMGANGAGKTTFFKCLLDLEKCRGTFDFDGLTFAQVRNQVFAVFDDAPLYPRLNGYANVEMLLNSRISKNDLNDAWKLGTKRSSVDLLKKPVRTYSSGQRKRLQLAAAILCRPRYLILDEVASGLDLETMDAAIRMIRSLKSESVIIASGHQFDFYARVVDRVVLLRNGHMEDIEGDGDRNASQLERIYRAHAAQVD